MQTKETPGIFVQILKKTVVTILSSNISIDRFYNNVDPITAIEELIEISSPKKSEKMTPT